MTAKSLPLMVNMQKAARRRDGAGVAAGCGASQQGECRIVPWRIESRIHCRDSARQVTKRRMIGVVHDWVIHDLPEKPKIRSGRFGEIDLVNAHVKQRQDCQRLVGRTFGGKERFPFENVTSLHRELDSDANDGVWRQWGYLGSRPDEAEVADRAHREELEAMRVACRVGQGGPAANHGSRPQGSEPFQKRASGCRSDGVYFG